MSFKSLRFEQHASIGRVVFSTPRTLNSITEARLEDLERLLSQIEANKNLRVLIVTGEGRGFCVGLDLEVLQRAFADMSYFERIIRRLNECLNRLEELPIPTIAAVNGYARAGGFEICLACDFILVAAEAKIGDNHAHVGVMPGGGSTQRLPRRIGAARAKQLIWSARWLTGAEAVEWGVALRSVPGLELASVAEELAREFTDKPAACLAAIKSAIRVGDGLPIRAAVEREIETFLQYMTHEPYAREGFLAQRAGRAPAWLAQTSEVKDCVAPLPGEQSS